MTRDQREESEQVFRDDYEPDWEDLAYDLYKERAFEDMRLE